MASMGNDILVLLGQNVFGFNGSYGFDVRGSVFLWLGIFIGAIGLGVSFVNESMELWVRG